ncbi:MAG: ATP synthase F1 subunit gamma [Erysipelotrichaceae bacterium]
MGQGTLALKARIRSVDSTRKITKAMQLVAASKLKKQRDLMDANKEYATYLKDSVEQILASLDQVSHPYLNKPTSNKPLTLVFTSNMGLCGGYNANVYRELTQNVADEEQVVVFGVRGVSWIKSHFSNVVGEVLNMEETQAYQVIARACDDILAAYVRNEVSQINIVYTKFVNSVTFEATKVSLLPIEMPKQKSTQVETLFEPSGEVILNDLIPMYLKSMIYAYYLETRTSEEASRRMAMETATDNADELKETLELQFNQARQASITQEISEIVAGADAL